MIYSCIERTDACVTDIFPKADLVTERSDTLFGKFVFKRNIVMLNGEEWKAQRKVRVMMLPYLFVALHIDHGIT